MARLSFVAQSSCSCKLDTAIRCHTSCCAGCPRTLWAWFCSWRSHPGLASLIPPSGATHPAAQDAHRGLGFALCMAQYLLRYCDTSYWTGLHSTLSYLICGASSCSTELVLASRCYLNKTNLVLFPLTVLRSLCFLIPPFTKINMSSNPVVHLPLTYAWGLLGMWNMDGSLAVLFPSLVGDSARGCSIPVKKLKWLHHLSVLWSSLLCCKQIDRKPYVSGDSFRQDKRCLAALSHACWRDPTCMTNW